LRACLRMDPEIRKFRESALMEMGNGFLEARLHMGLEARKFRVERWAWKKGQGWVGGQFTRELMNDKMRSRRPESRGVFNAFESGYFQQNTAAKKSPQMM
jgi:hypothetical protein